MFPGPVCVVLAPGRVAELREADIRGADCIEVRLDYLDDPAESADFAWNRLPRPVIATCRRRACGGMFDGTLDEELDLLGRAVGNGARYVDIDYRFSRPVGDAKVISSFHDFEGAPDDLEGVLASVRGGFGDVAKIAVMTQSWKDVRRVIGLPTLPGEKPVIAVGMGPAGELTRVVGPSRGSLLTYAASERASAPGQLSLDDLLETYRFRAIGPSTRVLGIVGNPVGHSASPALHNRAMRGAGLDYVYVKLPVVSLADFFAEAAALGIAGFSVTTPHKVGVLEFLDEVSGEARSVGAVNTVSRRGGRWIGDNTDVYGVKQALGGLDLRGMRVVVLGTGGAARAAVAALGEARSVVLLSRSMSPDTGVWTREVELDRLERYAAHEADLLINATPVGMSPDVDRSPVEGRIQAGIVFDMVYNPRDTRLLRMAREQGKRTVPGWAMFVAQAARQFEIWTGHRADPEIFGGTNPCQP